ncbi:Fe-S cluster assembly protein SufB [Spiroplasma endosymbiont of Amphibalanus improvisus]|uniref:Fe-S cluster assembly protein SufB n=1 Tax=Spiroplasma endosymbiont of Amphibalanus improvisus TaxID=3066327 RepID=UPI00313AD4DE
MKKLKQTEEIEKITKYKYGFNDDVKPVFKIRKGLNQNVVKEISVHKKEPRWMFDQRQEAYQKFLELENPKWGPDLNFIDFNDFNYYVQSSQQQENTWSEVPEKIKKAFDRLGLIDAEQKFLAGVKAQYDSELVYGNMLKEVEEKKVIFLDCDTALKKYPELFKEYFAQIVKNDDNKYAALNSAVWSGGSFIYVPKNVKLEKPLQSYFRINYTNMGQFERTIIIADEGSELHYIEGCTAPVYSKNSLHAAVVEIYVKKNAKVRYTTIQNWSDNVLNLVTKRAYVEKNGKMDWIDGNIGSKINMKYPSAILAGDNSKAVCTAIAVASKGVYQDSGAKMIHLGKNTSSKIIAKSITLQGGQANYRGLVKIGKNARNSKARVECDTLILDNQSHSDTIPTNTVLNNESQIEHEATVSKISQQQLFYLMSRGISEEQAIEMIVMGFLEPFTKELPLEYAVELNQLIKMDMEGSVG